MPSLRIASVAERWQRVLADYGECHADDGRHAWIWNASRSAAFHGIDPDKAADLIRSSLTRPEYHQGGEMEVDRAIRRAYAMRGRRFGSATAVKAEPLLEFDREFLARLAEKAPAYGRDFLKANSPVSVDIGPDGFLRRLYRPGETVAIVAGENQPDGKPKWRRLEHVWDSLDGDGTQLDYLREGFAYQAAGIWFMQQPIQYGAESWSEPNVARWPYVVIESDEAPEALWLRWLIQQPNIVAVYTSGGRSIHALQRIDARSKDHWDELIAPRKPHLAKVGADPKCLTAVRLTRLPFCRREEKNGSQELLWLDPSAGSGSILERVSGNPLALF